MDIIAGLTPMVVVGAAFVAIIVVVKRLADREEAAERAADDVGPHASGTRVHMVPVEANRDDLVRDERQSAGPDGEKPVDR